MPLRRLFSKPHDTNILAHEVLCSVVGDRPFDDSAVVSSRYRSGRHEQESTRGRSTRLVGIDLVAQVAQPREPTTVKPIITRVRILVDMRRAAPKPPPGGMGSPTVIGKGNDSFWLKWWRDASSALDFVKVTSRLPSASPGEIDGHSASSPKTTGSSTHGILGAFGPCSPR